MIKYLVYIGIYLFLSSCFVYQEETRNYASEDKATSIFYTISVWNKEKKAKEALNRLEGINIDSGIYSDSLLNMALHYYKNKEKTLELSKVYFYTYLYYKNIGQKKESFTSLVKAFENLPNLKDSLNKRESHFYGDLYYHLAENFAVQEDFKNALFYYQKAEKLYTYANQLNKVVLSCLSQSGIFTRLHQYDGAFYTLNRAHSLIKDSALLPALLLRQAQYYIHTGNYPIAKNKLEEILLHDIENYREEYYYTKADYFLKNNKADSARWYLSLIDFPNKKPCINKKYILAQVNIGLLENDKEKANSFIYKLDSLYYTNQEQIENYSLQNFIAREKLEQREKNYQKLAKRHQLLFIISSVLVFVIILLLSIHYYSIRKRKKELFESQLFIERLQVAEKEIKLQSAYILQEKDTKLKSFFNDRLKIIKNFAETSRKYGNNLEKLKVKFNSLVSTESFTNADWQLLREGVNITGYGLIDYLQKNYPTLTEENLRYCSLIYAGFETDELAILWGINNDSIYKKRTRLRQKLELKKNQDIKKFFDEIIESTLKKNI